MLGIALVIIALNSSSDSAEDKAAGGQVAPDPDAGRSIVERKPSAIEKPAVTPQKTEAVKPPVAQKPPETTRKASGAAEESRSRVAVVEVKKPAPQKPPEPEPPPIPVVTDVQLAGSQRLGPYLVTVRKPKAPTTTVKGGLKWLQHGSTAAGPRGVSAIMGLALRGGAGIPGVGFRRGGLPRGGQAQSNVPDTCIATLALIRSGSSPKEGLYANNILQSFCSCLPASRECRRRVARSAEGHASPTQPRHEHRFRQQGATLVQVKIGAHADTYLAMLLLSEVKSRMPDAQGEQRVTVVPQKTGREDGEAPAA